MDTTITSTYSLIKLISLAAITISSFASASAENVQASKEVVVNFSRDELQKCHSIPEPSRCLKGIFGEHAVLDFFQNGKLKEVTFRYTRGTKFVINQIKLTSKDHIKLRFLDGYSICGLRYPIQIDRFIFEGPDCVCGFIDTGTFRRELNREYDFIPNSALIKISHATCRPNDRINVSSVTLVRETKICGSKFPAESEFLLRPGGVEVEAHKSGILENSDGKSISIKKGRIYFNETKENAPCNWRQVADDSG